MPYSDQRSELETVYLTMLYLRILKSREIGRISLKSRTWTAVWEKGQDEVQEIPRVIGAVDWGTR